MYRNLYPPNSGRTKSVACSVHSKGFTLWHTHTHIHTHPPTYMHSYRRLLKQNILLNWEILLFLLLKIQKKTTGEKTFRICLLTISTSKQLFTQYSPSFCCCSYSNVEFHLVFHSSPHSIVDILRPHCITMHFFALSQHKRKKKIFLFSPFDQKIICWFVERPISILRNELCGQFRRWISNGNNNSTRSTHINRRNTYKRYIHK